VTAGYNVALNVTIKYICGRLIESEASQNCPILGKFCLLSNADFKTFSSLQISLLRKAVGSHLDRFGSDGSISSKVFSSR
jgi:hypothetical protein